MIHTACHNVLDAAMAPAVVRSIAVLINLPFGGRRDGKLLAAGQRESIQQSWASRFSEAA